MSASAASSGLVDGRPGGLMAWTDIELAELAICARYGAQKSREEAEKTSAVSVKHIHLRTAEVRDELARRLEAARKRLSQER